MEARALSQLLNEMDGMQGSDGVFVLACTNQPLDELDAAVLRPGRLELVFAMDLPSLPERKELIDLLAAEWPLDDSVDRDRLARVTAGRSCAAVRAALKRASLCALRRRAPAISSCDFSDLAAEEGQQG